MGKLIRVVLILGVLAIGALALLYYTSRDDAAPTGAPAAARSEAQPEREKEKIQVQEKYGVAPVGEDNP